MRVVLRKGIETGGAGERRMAPLAFVPEGDASEKASSSQGECSFDAETSEIG
jgi:hypothetical protein